MSSKPLPTKADFLANRLDPIPKCAICHEPFSSTHIPTRIRGPQQCAHVFGSVCLQAWLDSPNFQANTCPMCREVLFQRPPEILPGTRPENYGWHLEGLTSRTHAWTFVNGLRGHVAHAARTTAQIYESDLRDMVNINTWRTGWTDPVYFQGGLFVKDKSMPGLVAVVKDMMSDPPKEEGLDAFVDDRVTNWVWFERVGRVLGWSLERE